VRRGIDEALVKLRTDWLDIVHLHSCSEEVVRAGEVAGALTAAVSAGKVRVAAYSGENAALDAAVASGVFSAVELSLSPWDQGAIDRVLWKAKERGMGAIAKRPLANAWWTCSSRPSRPDIGEYWDRGRTLALPSFGIAPEALALRFAVFTWGIDCAVARTTSLPHLEALVRCVSDGQLPADVTRAVREAWRRAAAGWPGVV
jgi:aryl-alcohol dehydrogenase-like predicted oxidoreductase